MNKLEKYLPSYKVSIKLLFSACIQFETHLDLDKCQIKILFQFTIFTI